MSIIRFRVTKIFLLDKIFESYNFRLRIEVKESLRTYVFVQNDSHPELNIHNLTVLYVQETPVIKKVSKLFIKKTMVPS